MTKVSATATINGTECTAELGVIEDTMLGYEDRGFLTFWLELRFGGSTLQGFGGWALSSAQVPTPHAQVAIAGILRAGGCDKWEQLKGRHVYALRAKGGSGPIIGIMHATEHATVFIPNTAFAEVVP